MSFDVDRAFADLFGGFDGGWPFWLAALAGLEQAIARSREREGAFCSYPAGELGRFAYDLEAALRLAGLGVDLQTLLNGDGDERRRGDDLVELLHARVEAMRKPRENLP